MYMVEIGTGNWPAGKRTYLKRHGWHFSHRMCEWACSMMGVEPLDAGKVDAILSDSNVVLGRLDGCDRVYVANMCMSDFFGSSIDDMRHVALFVKDMIDDYDQADGFVFARFVSDCERKGLEIPWSDML